MRKTETETTTPDARRTQRGRRIRRALVGAALALTLTAGSPATFCASALTPPRSTVSPAFYKSRYYLNLEALKLTGDERTDLVMVAMSQLGYHEGDWTSQFHGENKTGSDNYVEYNYYNGKVDQLGNGVLTYAYPWCASFVSFCARTAGIPVETLRSSLNCSVWVNYFKEEGKWRSRASGYVPRQGDLVFFKSASSASISSHVGIVRYACNGTVYTIEGNSADQVRLLAYDLTDPYIIGYGVPDYKENKTTAIDYLLHRYTEGDYIIAAADLPVHKTPAYEGRVTFTLHRGDLMHVYEFRGIWGRTDYGWIPMTDTQPIRVAK